MHALLPLPVDGYGPSNTCASLVEGLHAAGVDIRLYTSRVTTASPLRAPTWVAMRGLLARVPHRLVAPVTSVALERRLLADAAPGDVAWLWPGVSLATHHRLRERGVRLLLESINTRMAVAREVLDSAYEALGAPPGHGITDERIREQDERFAIADAIFSPSPAVEASLADTPLSTSYLSSSYGTDTTVTTSRTTPGGRPVTVMFCGRASVRKGVHLLLDAWRDMPEGIRLKLVGNVEPLLAERYADVLDSPDVDAVGFTRDVHEHYRSADVFVLPSLEEGDPLVTYEAAHHGLPVVASPIGAGRMGADEGVATIIDPHDLGSFRAALVDHVRDPGLRRHQGELARTAVVDYDWWSVAARRATLLEERFG